MKIGLIVFCTMSLMACEGSDTYRGTWKAVDMGGAKLELTFDAKELAIKDITGKKTAFPYTQHSVKINNAIKTYGIQLGDGRTFFLLFPNPQDQTIAIFEDGQQKPVYALSRNGYKTYDDISRLQ